MDAELSQSCSVESFRYAVFGRRMLVFNVSREAEADGKPCPSSFDESSAVLSLDVRFHFPSTHRDVRCSVPVLGFP